MSCICEHAKYTNYKTIEGKEKPYSKKCFACSKVYAFHEQCAKNYVIKNSVGKKKSNAMHNWKADGETSFTRMQFFCLECKVELCICGKKHQGNETPGKKGYGGGMRAVCYGKDCYQCPKGEGHWFFALKKCLVDSKHYKYSLRLKTLWKDDWACGYHRNKTVTTI